MDDPCYHIHSIASLSSGIRKRWTQWGLELAMNTKSAENWLRCSCHFFLTAVLGTRVNGIGCGSSYTTQGQGDLTIRKL